MGRASSFIDLEQGGVASKDTMSSIERNIKDKNRSRLFVAGEAPSGIDTVKQAASQFDVVVIDSRQKLEIPNTRFDELRSEFPNTVFVVIFQQNGEGGTRGGDTADYDRPTSLKVHRSETSFKNSHVEIQKNRGNSLNPKWSIFNKNLTSDKR